MTSKNANFVVSSIIEEPLQQPYLIEGEPKQPNPSPDKQQPQQPPRPEDEPNKKRPGDVPPFPKPPLPPG